MQKITLRGGHYDGLRLTVSDNIKRLDCVVGLETDEQKAIADYLRGGEMPPFLGRATSYGVESYVQSDEIGVWIFSPSC